VEWDGGAPVTPLGQLPFFIEYLKQGGLFDGLVADCPPICTSKMRAHIRDDVSSNSIRRDFHEDHHRHIGVRFSRRDLGCRKVSMISFFDGPAFPLFEV